MPTVPPLLEVDDFAVRRRDCIRVELPNLRLCGGEVAALYGPSGCGKTTVLQGLMNLLPSASCRVTGEVRLAGRGLLQLGSAELQHCLRHQVVYLAQDAHAALDPLAKVGLQIQQATDCSSEAAAAAMAELGIDEPVQLCQRYPHQVSGGEAQRALLAIAFLRQPALVVADEPSASLDGGSYAELLLQLQKLLARDSCLLIATHDHRLLADLGASVYAAADGRFLPCELGELQWPPRPATSECGELPILQARGLRVAYGGRVVLDGVDFSIRRGEIVAVVGESGSGKTTLARLLAAHSRPDAGEIDRPKRASAVQLCCQDALASLTPGRSLAELIEEARNPLFELEAACRAIALDSHLLARTGALMSGGERRRAVLLRALAVHPDVLVLDEPTASLDRKSAIALMQSLLLLQKNRGLAVVLITHDLELARAFADRVVVVARGQLAPC